MQPLLDFPRFSGLCKFLHGQEIHIVGGTVRDLFLGRELRDLDLIVPRDCIKIARSFTRSERIPGFPLHTEMGVFRAVPEKGYSIDFTARQGPDLESDLLNRDFTFNAMAVPLDLVMSAGNQADLLTFLVDPTGGYTDLSNRFLRLIKPDAFVNDPLRMLRVFRFMVELDCQVEERTLDLAGHHNHRLAQVSRERIYHEFFRILDGRLERVTEPMVRSGVYRSLMDLLGCDPAVTGKDRLYSVGEFSSNLTETGSLSALFSEENRLWFRRYANRVISGGISHRALFHYFLLFSAEADPTMIERVSRELTLSNEAAKTLNKWYRARKMATELFVPSSATTVRMIRRFLFHFKEHAAAGCFSLLLSADDGRTGISPPEAGDLVNRIISEWSVTRLEMETLLGKVNGTYVMEVTGLYPGKDVGEILRAVQMAVYTGELDTEEQVRRNVMDRASGTELPGPGFRDRQNTRANIKTEQ